MGFSASSATTMFFAERSNEDVIAKGQGTEGHKSKAWPEHTLPFTGGAQEQGAGPARSTVKGNKKEDGLTTLCRDVRPYGFVSASVTWTTLLPESHLENYHTQAHAIPALSMGLVTWAAGL